MLEDLNKLRLDINVLKRAHVTYLWHFFEEKIVCGIGSYTDRYRENVGK